MVKIAGKFNNKLGDLAKVGAKKILIIVAIIGICFIMLAGMAKTVLGDSVNWTPTESGNPSNATSAAKASASQGVEIDKNEVINTELVNKGYSEEEIENITQEEVIEDLKMSEKLDKEINSLDDCTVAEIMWCSSEEYDKYLESPEQLEFLLNAQLVTQFPKIENLDENNVNGVIEFKRIKTDDSGNDQETLLKFVEMNEFDTMFDNYKNSGDTTVLNCFAVDDEGNAIVATWSEEIGEFESTNSAKRTGDRIVVGHTEETIKEEYDSRYTVTEDDETMIKATYAQYTINKVCINYKDMIKSYTLPFEYLWALLVMGRSYDFVEELAQLAYDSQIIIGIYDSVTTTVTVNTKTYTENFQEGTEEFQREDSYIEYSHMDPVIEEELNTGEDERIETEIAGITAEYESVGEEECTRELNYQESEVYTYYDQNKKTTRQAVTSIEIMIADVWIATIDTEVQNTNSVEPEQSSINEQDDEEWVDCEDYPILQEEFSYTPDEILEGDEIRETIIIETIEPTSETEESEEEPEIIEMEVDLVFNQYIEKYKRENSYRQQRITEKSTVSTINKNGNKYEKIKTNILEKTDTDEGTKNNFVKILNNNDTAFTAFNDKGTVDWLKEMLSENESTIDFVNLTFYLVNETFDNEEYDIGDFEFNEIFTPEEFKEVDKNNKPGGSYAQSATFEQFLHSWECANPPKNEEGDKYWVYCDYTGRLAAGYGVDIYWHPFVMDGWTVDENGPVYDYLPIATEADFDEGVADVNNSTFEKIGVDSSEFLIVKTTGANLSVNFILISADTKQPILIDKAVTDSGGKAVEQTASTLVDKINEEHNLNLTEYQKHALIAMFYNTGSGDDIANEFINCYKEYWDEETDNLFGNKEGVNWEHELYTKFFYEHRFSAGKESLIPRREAEWILFQTGYYNRPGVYYVESGAGSTNPDGLIRPVSENIKVSSGYGKRILAGVEDFHEGVDYDCTVGTELYATHDGIVIAVENDINEYKLDPTLEYWKNKYGTTMASYGNYVIIASNNGKFATLYAHCEYNGIKVNVGDTVSQGQVVAISGHTGNSSGPHLHFELRLDPNNYNNKYGRTDAELYIGNSKLKDEGYLD